MTVDHAVEDVFEVGIGFDAIELGSRYERADGGPSLCAAVGPSEEMILAPERDGPDGALHRVGIEFDTSVLKESAERGPTREGIADRLGQAAARRDAVQFFLEPCPEVLGQWFCLDQTDHPTLFGCLTTDDVFDLVERAGTAQRLLRDGRASCLVHLVELPSRVRPTRGQHDVATSRKFFEAGISVNLDHALEPRQM